MKLKDKSVLITGASQGLGRAIAETFAGQGASLLLTGRNEESLTQAKSAIEGKYRTQVLILKANAASRADNEAMARLALKQFGKIDVFVANAGIWGAKGPVESVDWNEWCETIDINLKGVVLGCRSVVPAMRSAGRGKIVVLSGGGATKPMAYFSAYAASKAGVVRFMETLAEELRDNNVDVNAVAPGALNTRMLDEVLAAGPDRIGELYYQQALKQKTTGGAPLNKAADLCVFLASAASDGITGKLISAVWDPWESFGERREELKSSDVYTLRRILPEDRNLAW